MLGTFLTPFIFPKWVEIRVILITCGIALGLSTFLIGPFFGEQNLTVMLIGLGLTGSFMGPLGIPNMAEMMQATKSAYPDCDLDHANSLLSGILNCCFGVGQALGPLLGAFLVQIFNFQTMCDIIGSFVICMALLYLMSAQGC